MEKRDMLYEGKAKKVFKTDDPNLYVIEYKDDATAFNGQKRDQIAGKGELNNKISALFFELLRSKGLDSHYVKRLSDREQLVRRVTIIPLEVVVRNIAAGSLAKRLGWEEGRELPRPVVEFYYKSDELGDPLINESHIAVLGVATPEQLDDITTQALKINEILTAYLRARNILLVDFKLEFGLDAEGRVLLADEISPDTCRFWDATTREKLDKDRFRRDLGGVEEAYEEVLHRLGGQ
ncbi:phosphoribosylaminoimidazolesuccinocarboxamide synthase [Kyrpidia spormannii]|uniref:Phosphoribosylaminoimidazole-succinocarboxamide synthase n=1 Tax=Kyrpidia spormannii TaxID=2055160 RepID=A0A2K8NAL8_9BACL|nr:MULTISPECIES: phosphoribosylaminoimidazolesuccinocarboxamide synthase [Kyrpidia]ATY86353.1 phosphoribosylaminoimidazolesuccinocarboxamide synthase [Kyrpidia spormannii]MCL6575668.1 phosphoribosylaminoimidazolesuccinocarboxamide synthase [Kyrpidia sp.]HHY65918.1 phosphoribosylaminoimidazolesuccinocarboxamide synthase [Alicyclobacillus sp.]